MTTSASALTGPEWAALLDVASALAPRILIDPDLVDRLFDMGLIEPGPAGRPRLTWTGREFVELRLSGLLGLVGRATVGANES